MKLNYYISIIIIIVLTSCATAKTHNVENTIQRIELQIDLKEAYRIALQTAMEMQWEIIMSDSEALAFSGKTPQTMQRWEDTVNIYLTNTGELTTITVRSRLGHEPNVNYIKSYLQNISAKTSN